MTTGQLIKAARIKAGLTQAALAEKLGISYVGVSQWENGIRNPKPETLQKIADALDISVSSLLGRGDDILSPSLQRAFREAFLKRVEGELIQADPADMEEVYGTDGPYEGVFEGKETLTLKRAEEMADELGVPLEYLIAGENSPADDLVAVPVAETAKTPSALTEDERQKLLEQINIIADSARKLFSEISALVGLDKRLFRDVSSTEYHTDQEQQEIVDAVKKMLKTATREEREKFILQLTEIWQDYEKQLERADIPSLHQTIASITSAPPAQEGEENTLDAPETPPEDE